MPSTEALMAWTIQVDVVSLCASLEALARLESTIKVLNRAYISDLPEELLEIIKHALIRDKAAKLRPFFELDFACHRLTCNPAGHLCCLDLQDFKARAAEGLLPGEDLRNISMSVNRRVETWIEGNSYSWMAEHVSRRMNWQAATGFAGHEHRGMFSVYQRVMKEHFGMDVWVSHHRSREYFVQNWWERLSLGPPDTTIAFLILADITPKHIESDLNDDEFAQHRPWVENGFGFPVKIPKPLPKSKVRKFRRMMIDLGLKPHTDESQHDLTVGAIGDGGDSEAESDEEVNSKPSLDPKLTMLVRNNMRDEWEP